MKRAQVAALWVATIVATWFIVRSQTSEEHAQPTAEPAAAPARSAHVAVAPRPALSRQSPDPLDTEAYERARATLEHDMADGRWTLADRDRLNAATSRVSGKQAFELYKVLFPKLNSGEVKSDIDGPPI